MADALYDAQRYTDLIKRLQGIYAAQVKLNAAGEPEEVHMLASMSRHPKQVVRDARTALLSAFGIDVDYQKFSVAQLSDELGDAFEHDPALEASSPDRLRCGGIEQSLRGEHYSVSVSLVEQDATYKASMQTHNSPMQRQRAIATAVLDAVHQYLGCEQPVFVLLAVQRITTTMIPLMVVMAECIERGRATLLVGAAECSGDEALSVQKATLDAINRKLPVLRPL